MTLPAWLRRSLVGVAFVVHAQAGEMSIIPTRMESGDPKAWVADINYGREAEE